MTHSYIYMGELMHARWWPVKHAFTYPVYLLALDLDELPALHRRLRLFSYNKPNVVALYDRDYLHAGAGLAAALRRFHVEHGSREPARIVALTHARVFGYVFNPVSFFYALDAAGGRASVVAEVNNTFGDTHRYLLDGRNATGPASHATDKLLHVSPFMDMRCRYDWRLDGLPGDASIEVNMDVTRRDAPFFAARLTLRRRPLTDGQLAAALVRYPLATAQVTAKIHLQALRLWMKGAPFRSQSPYDPQATQRKHQHDRQAHDAGAGAPRSRHDLARAGAEDARDLAARPPDPQAA